MIPIKYLILSMKKVEISKMPTVVEGGSNEDALRQGINWVLITSKINWKHFYGTQKYK